MQQGKENEQTDSQLDKRKQGPARHRPMANRVVSRYL